MTLPVSLLVFFFVPKYSFASTPNRDQPSAQELWRTISTAQLDDLLQQALQHNPNLQASRAQAWRSEALRRQSLARLLPSLSLELSETNSPYDSLGFQFGGLSRSSGQEDPPWVFSSGSAMLKAGWSADIWGRSLLEYQASSLEAEAGQLDTRYQKAALSAQLATAYFDVVTAEDQRSLLAQQQQRNQTLLELITVRAETGSASALDMLQQRQQLASLDAQIAPVDNQIMTAQMNLAELVGLRQVAQLPRIQATLPNLDAQDDPARWISADLSRPDLRAAMLKAEASQARARSAVRSRLPNLTLQGQAGLQANYATNLNGQNTWSVGAALSWPVDLVGLQRAQIQQAEATAQASAASYQSQALAAHYQVQRAVATWQAQQQRVKALQRQHRAASLAYQEARERYLAGLETYLTVLSALAPLQQAELALLLAQRDVLAAQINTFFALGQAPALEGQ